MIIFYLLLALVQAQIVYGQLVTRSATFEEILKEEYLPKELENDLGFIYLPSPRIFLCSEPSSGNTWCRYVLECLTKRPSTRFFIDYQYDKRSYYSLESEERNWFNAINPPFGVQFPEIGIDYGRAPILKIHNPRAISQIVGKQPLMRPSVDKFILIVRDYREIYYRKRNKEDLPPVTAQLKGYLEMLQFYDLYPEERKLMVYFEDLLFDSKRAFARILEFLEDDSGLLDEFILQLDFHKQRCFSLYNIPKHCESSGQKDFTYTKSVVRSNLILLEKMMKHECGNLFNKYLNRYEMDE